MGGISCPAFLLMLLDFSSVSLGVCVNPESVCVPLRVYVFPHTLFIVLCKQRPILQGYRLTDKLIMSPFPLLYPFE